MNDNIVEFQRNSAAGVSRRRGQIPYAMGEREIAMLEPPTGAGLHSLVSSGGAPRWEAFSPSRIVSAVDIDGLELRDDPDGSLAITNAEDNVEERRALVGLAAGNGDPSAIAAAYNGLYVADRVSNIAYFYRYTPRSNRRLVPRVDSSMDFALPDGGVQGFCFVNPLQGEADIGSFYAVSPAGIRLIGGGVTPLHADNTAPTGIVLAQNQLYVSNNNAAGNYVVFVYNRDGAYVRQFSMGFGRGSGLFSRGIAYSPVEDRLYWTGVNQFRKIARQGTDIEGTDQSAGSNTTGASIYGPVVYTVSDDNNSITASNVVGVVPTYTRINGQWMAGQ